MLKDLLDVWDEPISDGSDIARGKAALRIMSVEEPAKFAQLGVSVLPKEVAVEAKPTAELSHDELDAQIEQTRAALKGRIASELLELEAPKDYSRVD